MASPARKRIPLVGVKMVAVGGLPTAIGTLFETLEFTPSETVRRAT